VWDNFESASGIADADAKLSSDDREVLRRLLQGLRGGKTKVIITSRTNEEWLSPTECCRLKELEGLEGEELWAYCNAVVSDLGLNIQRDDENFQKLIEKLDGNPLAIRAILLGLTNESAQRLLEELNKQFEGYPNDESTRRLESTWALLEDAFDARLEPILQLIGLHEYMLDSAILEAMLEETTPDLKPADIANCLSLLMRAGQCSRHRQNKTLYHLHPALHGYLNERHHAPEELQRIFIDVFSELADILAPKKIHEQQPYFEIYAATLYQAKRLATELSAGEEELTLTQGLASYAQNSRNFNEANQLFTEQADRAKILNNPAAEAPAYHQLGMVAQERRDFDAAEAWYEKSLEISERKNIEYGMAITYHQLGIVAEERRDFEAAEAWYEKSLEIKLRLKDEYGAAITYHQLGMVAEERRDFDAAEAWYEKSLEIFERLGDEYSANIVKGSLTRLAENRTQG
jgi:tetratricopeptide (TPR) repeat protein